MTEKNIEALKLFVKVLRTVRKLPPETRSYYRNYAYQHFVNHKSENDERAHQIIERAKQDIEWIERKYGVYESPSNQ